MFGLATKKEVKKELDKISEGFKERDKQTTELKSRIAELEKKLSIKELEVIIKSIIFDLQTGLTPHLSPNQTPNRTKKPTRLEQYIVKKAVKRRPEAVKIALKRLLSEDMPTSDIYRELVEEKQLIGKTQFYHYLSIVRNELKSFPEEVRTEPNRTKPNKTGK